MRILVLWKTRIGEFFFFFFIRESLFCGKPESEKKNFFSFLCENSRFVEKQNWRIFFFSYPRILVLRETRIGDFFFFFFFMREFSFCGKPDSENFFFFSSENPRFVENQNLRIFFFFFLCENSRFVENQTRRIFFFFLYPRILVLWKTRIGEFFFFFLCENSRFVENQNRRIFFFFFLFENSRFVENQNRRIIFLSFFFFLCENSRFVENQNRRIFFFRFFYPRILVLWKTRIGE